MTNKGLRYFIAFIIAMFALFNTVHSQVGQLDTSFFKAYGAEPLVYDGFEQPDGSVIIAGNFTFANQQVIRGLTKFNSHGSTDNSFNAGGVGTNNTVNVSVRNSIGQIVIGGIFTTYNGVTTNRIGRINADGLKDGSFTASITNGAVNSLCTLSDGSIIAVGSFTAANATTVNRIVKFTSTGTKDASFNIGTGANNEIKVIVQQADGKFIITGNFTSYNGTAINRIARLNSDGTLDTSFNPGTGANDIVGTITIDQYGRIYISGNFTSYNGTSVNRIARLNSDGTRDASFDVGTGLNNACYHIECEDNGKIVLTGGFTSYKGSSVPRITRIDTTGTRDTTFTVGLGVSNNTGYRAIKCQNNKYLVLGTFTTFNTTVIHGIVKLENNGAVDNTYMPSHFNWSVPRAIGVQSDGKVIVVGEFTEFNTRSHKYIVRLDKEGNFDPTFNKGTGANGIIYTVEVLPNDKILIGGHFTNYNGTSCNRIARLNSDGTYDNTFNIGTGFNNVVSETHTSSNGKIYVIGGFSTYKGVAATRIIRLLENGTRDNSFNCTVPGGYVTRMVLSPSGHIFVTGDFTSVNGKVHYAIAKLDSTGTVDSTFRSGSGLNTSSSGDIAIELQKDGKVLLGYGGSKTIDGVVRSRIVRLNINGSIDNSFDPSNTAITTNGVSDIQILNDGILCIGNFTVNNTTGHGVKFINTDGTNNGEFESSGGKSNPPFSVFKDDRYGRLLVTGQFQYYKNIYDNFLVSLKNYIENVAVANEICQGDGATVYFDKRLTFNPGNIFTVQLSNASGSFASPVTIGVDTTDGWGPDSVLVKIPQGTAAGSGYRLRVVSTSPVFTTLSVGPITINASPTSKVVLQKDLAVYPSLGTEIKVVAAQAGVKYSLMDNATAVDTSTGSGDTLRLRTGGIHGTKNYIVKAQLGGCSLALDTVSIDTLGVRHVEWDWVGFTKNPDNSITAEPEPGDDKMEGKSYNLLRRGKDGIVTFSFLSDHDYSGFFAFGDHNKYSDIGYGFLLAQDTVSGPDSLGLYLMLEKDRYIPLRGLTGGPLTVTMHKHGNVGDIYINGLLQDTTITWPDTLDFDIQLAAFAPGSIKSITTSYAEFLRWDNLQAYHADCGGTGSVTASVAGGMPPYRFHWSNGDTTSVPDSLLIGLYRVTVTDFAGDTLIDSIDIVYNAMIDSAHNVGPDSLGRMVSSGFTEFFSSYCWYVNTMPVGADGWIRYDVPEGTNFQGYVGFSSNTLFDESHRGFGIMVFGNGIYVTGDDIEGMGYLGSYEPGQKLSLKMRFEGDYLYCGRVEEWGTMEMPFYLPRATIFRPGVVQLAEGSIYPVPTTTFNCDQMFVKVGTTPSAGAGAQGQANVAAKGGKAPYTYLWSNSATTTAINVLPGTYTVTVTDANSNSVTASVFVGTYVEWLASNNVEETPAHEVIATANTPAEYGLQHNYIFGAHALKPGQDGTFSFDFARAGDFAGTIGVSTDYLMTYGSQGFGLVIVQDRMDLGIDPEIYYVDEEGQMQYFGSFTEQMPMNIKIKKTGTLIEIIKNDIGGIDRAYPEPLTFRPIISPMNTGDKVTKVTADIAVPLQVFSTVQPTNCGGGNTGAISLNVLGGQPPYRFNWSNGDTTATPDSLQVGLYAVQVWDAALDTIVDSIFVGYGMDWDTTFNVGDSLGMLVSTGNNSTESFNSYAYALNSLMPGEDGWVEFEIPQNTVFNGAMAMNANKHYDETTEGIGVNIVNGYVIIRGSMIPGNTIMAPYKPAAGYKFRFEFTGNNIDITYKDLLSLAPGRKVSVAHTRANAWSPTVIFGLNGAEITSISSSFGCGGMHADVQLVPASEDGNTGSIYSQIKGGYPPYTYTWSNSAGTANLVNVPIGSYSLTVQDQSGATRVVNTFLGRYTDWDILSGMAELGNGVIYEGDTVDFDSTIVNFAIAKNAIKPSASGTVSFDFERAGDFTGAVGLSESADLFRSQDGALAVVGLIDGDLYILDENGDPAFFGKLRKNLPVNIQVHKTPTEFAITKNNLSTMYISRATTGYLSPVVIPGFPGDKLTSVTCDFGRKLSVKTVVTPVTCGTANSGSISAQAIGGIPPYSYHWDTGDTTDVNDSLTVGQYDIMVTDSIGDTAVAHLTMGYGGGWSELVGVDVAADNSLSPSLPFSPGNAYAVGSGTLYPVVGETGWMEFNVEAGVPFEGYFGLVNGMTFDANMVGVGILVNGGHIYSSDTDPDNENMYLGRYNPGVENNIRIDKVSDDQIRISINGVALLESEYSYPSTFKPVVYLNNDRSKVKRLVSSFCNTYQDDLLVLSKVLHVSPTHKGAIYLEVEGGNAPYTYTWSDIVVPADTVVDDIFDSLMSMYSSLGLSTAGLREKIENGLYGNSSRQGLSVGDYSVTVTDASNRQTVGTFQIGTVSKFMYTSTLTNELGLITKNAIDGWTNNACISTLSSNQYGTPYFEFIIAGAGDFDFGYRDLSDTIIGDSLNQFSVPEYLANEYYFVKIRSGNLNYASSQGGNASNIVALAEGDKVSMFIGSNYIQLKKNGVAVYTGARSTASPYSLHSSARIYNQGSSFRIVNNIIR